MSSADFRRVFAAEVVSTFGSLMSRLAIPWLAVLVLDAGPASMALLAMADVAASAGAALLLGALVDRWPKRRTMIACDLLRAAMLATVPLMAAGGLLTIAWLVAVVAVNGALTVAFELAQSACIARSTTHEHLTERNSALAAGGAVTEATSFGLTGWLFQWLGAVVVMVMDALTYVASAVLLLKIGEPAPLAAETPADRRLRSRVRALVSEVQAGLRAVAAGPVLRALAIVATLVAFGTSFASTTYMIYVSRDVAFSTGTLGLLFALGGIGSLAGSWLTARTARRIDARSWLVVSLAVWAVGSAAAPLATAATVVGVALIALQQIVGDAGGMAYHITDRTLRQTHAAPELLARVDASVRTLGYVATLVGALLSGVLAELFGARALLFASSALVGVAAIAAALLLRAPRIAPAAS
jgi:predicted MFS family arabinose efflux permease